MSSRRFLPRVMLVLVLPLVLLGLAFAMPSQPAAASLAIYGDALGAGWNDWSWDPITHNLSNTSPVHAGSDSIAVTYTGAWSGLKLSRNGDQIDASLYDTLSFWVNGGSGGQHVTINLEGTGVGGGVVITPTANTWTKVNLPLSQFGSPSFIVAVDWFNNTNGAQPTFYLDDISLLNAGLPTPTSPAPSAGPALTVNAAAGQHAISPDIYGMNFADPTLAADINLPVNRWGGNATTRYNWQLDISNHASDWYFENIDNVNANPGALPNGSSSDQFVSQNRASGTDSLLTLPLIGWTPKGPRGANPRNCGFSTSLYPSQQSIAPDAPCGNGLLANGTPITGNSPLATSFAISPTYDANWVSHLVSQFGAAGAGGVRFYDLDNEPALWNSTQRDVHPQPASYDELTNQTLAYAPAIKAADPGAKLLGPVPWGWTEYFYSALDEAPGGAWWNNPQDRLAHGNVPWVEYYLQQMHAYEQAHGQRLLDYVDVHFYPQESGVALSGAGSTATQQLRLRSTRGLWDPTYLDESWINDYAQLIPRMKTWVANDYPGTKLAISEYNWGALDNINGAVAQADVLGIFGREGLDLATLWAPPAVSDPGAFAFRLYRNYDGAHGTFGDTSVQANSADQSQLAVYAALRGSDSALTIMVVNKSLTQTLTSSLGLSSFAPGPSAAVYRYSSADLQHIVHQPDQAVSNGSFTADYPPQSITLFILSPGGTSPTATSSGTATGTGLATATRTPTTTAGPTSTASPTATRTQTPAATVTPTGTSTATPTATATGPTTPGQWLNIDIPSVSNNFNNPANNYGYNTVVVDQGSPNIVYVGTNYQGIYRSTDGGATWNKIDTGAGANLVDGGRIWSLAIDPFNPTTLYAASGYGFGGPLKSTDGGVSWINTLPASSPVEQQLGTNDVYNVVLDHYTPNHLLASFHYYWLPGASDSGVIESTDGGATWTVHNAPAGSGWGAGNSVWFLNNSATWLLGSQNAGYWRTTNSGANWTQVSTNSITHGGVNAVYREPATGVLYAAYWHGIMRSTDNGASWTDFLAGLPYAGFETIVSDGANLYTAPSFPNGGDNGQAHGPWYAVALGGSTWAAYNSQQTCDSSNSVCNGPVMMARDATGAVIYAVNWLGGVWKLVTTGTVTATGTATAGPTGTPTTTASATPTSTATIAATATKTRTPTPTGTSTSASTATATRSPTPTATSTATAGSTATGTPTATGSAPPTATQTPTAPTTTVTASATGTVAATATPTPTSTATATRTATLTSSPSPTATSTHTVTPSAGTAAATPTASGTPTATATTRPRPTRKATATSTGTLSPTPSGALTANPTVTATPSPTKVSFFAAYFVFLPAIEGLNPPPAVQQRQFQDTGWEP